MGAFKEYWNRVAEDLRRRQQYWMSRRNPTRRASPRPSVSPQRRVYRPMIPEGLARMPRRSVSTALANTRSWAKRQKADTRKWMGLDR